MMVDSMRNPVVGARCGGPTALASAFTLRLRWLLSAGHSLAGPPNMLGGGGGEQGISTRPWVLVGREGSVE